MNPPSILMAHPSSELYGSDRVFAESVFGFIEDGWRVTVVLPEDGDLVDLLEDKDVRVVLCPTPILRKSALKPKGLVKLIGTTLRALPVMLRLLRKEKPNAVYVNTVTAPLWPILARIKGYKVLSHVHEAEEGVPRVVQLALAAPLLAANTVVVNSLATRSAIKNVLPRVDHRTELLYNSVPGPQSAEVVSQKLSEPIKLVLVGRISPRKGTDVAVEAVTLLHKAGRKVQLTIVGAVFTGYEWYEQQLRDQIAAAGTGDYVKLAGFHHDVWDSFRDADIALVPSRNEPFGNVSVEAQLAGRPVIVSNAQGLPETVESGRYGTVVPLDDPEALAQAISDTIDNWPAAAEKATAAKKWAEETFAPDKYRSRMIQLVENLNQR